MNFEGFLLSFLGGIVAVIATWLALKIYFIVSLQKLLHTISPSNRVIEHQALWYLIIPFFNLFWNFNVVNKIAYSLRLEYYTLGLDFKNNPSTQIGIFWAFSSAFYLIAPFITLAKELSIIISIIGVVLSLLSVAMFFSYWTTIITHRKFLEVIREAQNRHPQTIHIDFQNITK